MNQKNPYRKKLIEVALPLEIINKASSKEKSIRHGHPCTLHIWWARRPLAACRAVLFASLVDDPGNDLNEKDAKKKRQKLFKIIAKLVEWDNTKNQSVWKEAQKEIKNSVGEKFPSLLDPFCGGGSIPMEAQRLGLSVYTSDLNPVAVLITKSLIEIPQKFSGVTPVNPNTLENKIKKGSFYGLEGIVADIEYYGRWMHDKAKKRIGHLYPKIDGRTPVVWLWARTIKCPNPTCGAEIPLIKSFQVLKIKGKKVWLKPIFSKKKRLNFEIQIGNEKIPAATINGRVGAKCLVCNEPTSMDYIRKEGKSGRMTTKLLATIVNGEKTLTCLPPTQEQIEIANKAKPTFIPKQDLIYNSRYLTVPEYGIKKFGDLFTRRQLTALSTFSDLVPEVHKKILHDAVERGYEDDERNLVDGGKGAKAYADAVITYLSFAVDRCANYWSTLTPWGGSFIVQTFSRQALPMVWDFAEGNPFSNRTGNWLGAIHWITLCLKKSVPIDGKAIVDQLDASTATFPQIQPIICTDPPYYDNIGYSDLADFFYVWLRRNLSKIYPMLFSTVLTPKNEEIVAMSHRFDGSKTKAKKFFLERLSKAFDLIYKNSNPNFPFTIFYAYKQEDQDNSGTEQSQSSSSGWETMLDGLISAGFQIVGTWPMRTERYQGMKSSINALASSIVLVCRKRSDDSPMSTRREFISLLRKDLSKSLMILQYGNIAPVDLAQASIGPGMAIFSKYSKVLEADGNKMEIRTALEIINQELGSYLMSSELEFDQNTRFCLAWFVQYGFQKGPFGDADVLARAKNTSVEKLEKLGLIESGGGKVRLLEYSEMPEDFKLGKLEQVSIWFIAHLLIKKLESEGEKGVAEIIQKIGVGTTEIAKVLAYRLYSICDKKKLTEQAMAYNNLVSSWSTIQKKVGLEPVPEGQMRL